MITGAEKKHYKYFRALRKVQEYMFFLSNQRGLGISLKVFATQLQLLMKKLAACTATTIYM